jgi:hypothetical protein
MKQNPKLQLEWPADNYLAGIVASSKDHKMAYDLNRLLELHLVRADDLELFAQGKPQVPSGDLFSDDAEEAVSKHGLYSAKDALLHRQYFLFTNQGTRSLLLPELRNLTFVFMMYTEHPSAEDWSSIVNKISELPQVNSVFALDPEKIPSRFNLLL